MKKIKPIKGYSLFPKGSYTLVTTDDSHDYNDYVEWCEMNEIEPCSPDSHEFNEWCEDETQMNVTGDMDNLRYLSECIGDKFVIEGWMGLWWGHPEVVPTIVDNLADAVVKCVGESVFFDVKWENGVITVTSHHHDGTNIFEITAVSAHGLKKLERCENNGTDFIPCKDDKKRIPYIYNIAV